MNAVAMNARGDVARPSAMLSSKPPGGAVPSGARISVEPRAESRTGNDRKRRFAVSREAIDRPPSDHPVGESGNLRGPKSPAKIINGSPLSNWILFD
jgi:hypothetical protein